MSLNNTKPNQTSSLPSLSPLFSSSFHFDPPHPSPTSSPPLLPSPQSICFSYSRTYSSFSLSAVSSPSHPLLPHSPPHPFLPHLINSLSPPLPIPPLPPSYPLPSHHHHHHHCRHHSVNINFFGILFLNQICKWDFSCILYHYIFLDQICNLSVFCMSQCRMLSEYDMFLWDFHILTAGNTHSTGNSACKTRNI